MNTRDYILAGNYTLLDGLIAERDALAAEVARLKASVEELQSCVEGFMGIASEVEAYVDKDTAGTYDCLCQSARSALARTSEAPS